MSYIKSLRFKLMKLCVIPLFAAAFLFIAHSVVIAYQLRDKADALYLAAASAAGADSTVITALQNASPEMSWIAVQWTVVFLIMFVCFYIPITINIGRFIAPIRQLDSYAGSLAQGDVHIEVVKNRDDEIGKLQESFQKLVQTSCEQADLIQQISEGDLTGSFTPRSDADIVGHSLVRMLERNNVAMVQVHQSAKQLAVATSHIAGGSQTLAQGSTEQAAAVEQLSSIIAEIARQTEESTSLADKAAVLSETIRENAEKGSTQMDSMMSAVRDISDASHGINKVIKVIDDIAFQTNILALNAAVEAARAGQHGKGFAVVADEVRSLAAKSAEAAKDTGSLIAGSVEKAELGARIAEETAVSLAEIVSGIRESDTLISGIAKASAQQSGAISQIVKGVEQVSQVVQQNSATAEQSAAASQQMSGQAEMLEDMVSQFKLKSVDYLPQITGRTI